MSSAQCFITPVHDDRAGITTPHENAQGGDASVPFQWMTHGML